MYRCEVCERVVESEVPQQRVVVETRPREYPSRPKAHWHPPRAGGKGKWVDDPGGDGREIVREVRACPACAARLRALDG